MDGSLLHELVVDVTNRLLVGGRSDGGLSLLETLCIATRKTGSDEVWFDQGQRESLRSLTEESWGSIALPAAIFAIDIDLIKDRKLLNACKSWGRTRLRLLRP